MAREKLPFSNTHKLLEVLSAGLLVFGLACTIIQFANAPDTIPMHYNIRGEIDRWGSKQEIAFMPILTAILFCAMTLLECFPGIWNTPAQPGDHCRTAVLNATRTLLIIIKMVVTATFCALTLFTVWQMPPPPLFTLLVIVALALPLVLYLIYARNCKRKSVL